MRVARLLLADDGRDFVGRTVDAADLVFGGLVGHRHFGTTMSSDSRTPWHARETRIANLRQISLVSLEECAEIAATLELPTLGGVDLPALIGTNLVLADAPGLTDSIAPGMRLQFPSGATLFVTERNPPCRQPGDKLAAALGRPELALGFPAAAKGRRGIVALVEREGRVATGDVVKPIRPRPW